MPEILTIHNNSTFDDNGIQRKLRLELIRSTSMQLFALPMGGMHTSGTST